VNVNCGDCMKVRPSLCAYHEQKQNEIREIVECDDNCGAYEQPKTFKEYKAAWEHWRGHSSLSGCSHER
jgi:hypothetical protein